MWVIHACPLIKFICFMCKGISYFNGPFSQNYSVRTWTNPNFIGTSGQLAFLEPRVSSIPKQLTQVPYDLNPIPLCLQPATQAPEDVCPHPSSA